MLNKLSLLSKLMKSTYKVQREELFYDEIFKYDDSDNRKNEFLFFIKPEITTSNPNITHENIYKMILDKIEQYDFIIHNVKVISAKYLKKYDIIAQHYGVINKLALSAKSNLSDNAKESFEIIFKKPLDKVQLLGGFEFLEKFKIFNPVILDYFIQNSQINKLAPGTYCSKIKIDTEEVFLINGFHPRQLYHFTDDGRSIIVMTLSSDLDWIEARNNFIGATNPLNAMDGSIRRELFVQQKKLGIPEISQGLNGVHLSAGPLEALVELIRYNSNFSKQNLINRISDFSFGKKLENSFSQTEIQKFVSNENYKFDDKNISTFDLTEEKNSDQAIRILKTLTN